MVARAGGMRQPPNGRLVALLSITHAVIMGLVIGSFRDRGTEDVFDGDNTRAARRTCPQVNWPPARRKLDQLNRVDRLTDLRIPPGNRLEALPGHRAGQHSIRINQQYRICFVWRDGDAYDVEITDYHE
jgi:toxin HigB-1